MGKNPRPLGARFPTDHKHIEKYLLTARTVPAMPVPVVLGINWYSNFDNPIKGFDGRNWIGRGNIGSIRGGHAICLLPPSMKDLDSWWRYYDQGQEGACFPAGTRIQKADGTHVPIESLKLLDYVRTAEGNVGVVSANSVRWNKDGLYHIRLRGHVGVKATAEHPFLTKSGYVKAAELVIGDEIALTRVPEYENTTEIHVDQFVSRRARKTQQNGTREFGVGSTAVVVETVTVPETLALTPQLGRLFGLYLAEGCTSEQRVVWCFGGHEKDTLVEETVELIASCLGLQAHVQYRPNGSINVVIYGKAWREVFEGLFSTGSGNKRIPAELISASNNIREAVLYGWLAGDGHRQRTQISGVTISHDLALGMFTIANDLGLCPTINCCAPSMNKHAKTRQPRWEVSIPEGDGRRPDMDNATTWRKVSEITVDNSEQWVYNLTVSGDHSFVAEGIGVHNCVGFASSRMMSLLNRKQYDAHWLYDNAQRIDEWDDTPPAEGTSVRAAMDVLRDVGHKPKRRFLNFLTRPQRDEGISENRWATTVEQVVEVLGDQTKLYEIGAVPFLNSWGTDYPQITWMPFEILERLLREDGEATMITDRPNVR